MSGNSSYSSAVEGTGAAGTPSTGGRLRLIDDSRTIVRPLSVTNSIRASRHCGGSGLSSPAPIHSPHADAIRAHQRLSSPAPIHSPHADAIRGHQRLSSPAPIHSPHSDAIRGHQRMSSPAPIHMPTDAVAGRTFKYRSTTINGTQWSSGPISSPLVAGCAHLREDDRRPRCPSCPCRCRPQRICRASHLSSFTRSPLMTRPLNRQA